MMLCRLLTVLGLAPVLRPDDRELHRSLRQARAAAWRHGKLASSAQTASLDRIEQHVTDKRGDESMKSAESLKETVRAMLGKMP